MGASVCECVRERGRERERVSKGVSQRVRAKDREIAFTFRPGQLVRISHSETFIEKKFAEEFNGPRKKLFGENVDIGIDRSVIVVVGVANSLQTFKHFSSTISHVMGRQAESLSLPPSSL